MAARHLATHSPAARLPLQLAEQVGSGATKSSYLCKYRGHATGSLWAPTWELRWVCRRLTAPAPCLSLAALA